MSKRKHDIPVNSMAEDFSRGISIDKLSIKKSDLIKSGQYKLATQSHRDEGHTFHIVEKGTVSIEIDFKQYKVTAPSVVYMHPDQVHRILDFKNVTVCSLAITNESLNPDYIRALDQIIPAEPLALPAKLHATISQMFSLSLYFFRQKSNRLYYPLLRDSCNTLVAFLASQFLNRSKPEESLSRYEKITKGFHQSLELNYRTWKRPGDYARVLNVSTPYLNECIRHVTGFSVTLQIRDRIMLEAKRLLHHTEKSVKEIASDLGFTDYPYFTRVFNKATGLSPLQFRGKNND